MTFRSALVTTNGWPIGGSPVTRRLQANRTADVKGNGSFVEHAGAKQQAILARLGRSARPCRR